MSDESLLPGPFVGELLIASAHCNVKSATLDRIPVCSLLSSFLSCVVTSHRLPSKHTLDSALDMALRIGFLHLGRLGCALLCSLVLLSLADFESSQLQQSLDPGGQTYLGSPVVVELTLPTLYYNCALMPAICANVQQWLTANSQVLPKDFHIQVGNERNTAIRRSKSCPSNWAANHPCPEPFGQPTVVHGWGQYINGNAGRTMVQFGNSLLSDLTANPPIQSIFTNEIEGTVTGESSGLGYTCDEFPPAS
jgi:hypothetical protein